MQRATDRVEIGVRDFRNGLSRHLVAVKQGDSEILVTNRGRPVARILPLDGPSDRLGELAAQGLVRPPTSTGSGRPQRRTMPGGSVSDLTTEQQQ